MKRIRLALNVVSLLSPATGIAAYTRNLAEALLQSDEVEAYFFYIKWSRNVRDVSLRGFSPLKKLFVKLIPYPYEVSRFFQQARFRIGIARYQPDIYHEPNYLAYDFDGPTVITVHDLSHIRYPETHPRIRVAAMNKYLPPAIERAAQIIVDSEFVKNEVVSHFGVDPAKVHAIHLGVGKSYAPRSRDEVAPVLARYGLTVKGYILAVGTLEPRKNLIQALAAHAALPERVRRDLPLVIAGGKGWLTGDLEEKIRGYGKRGEVRWLRYVPGEMLPFLYSGARFLVYPSLYEGFGLPILEAMASGIPVITSNQASLPEVAGEAGVMLDPHDRDALREAMLRMIEDKEDAQRRGAMGIAWARHFTWQTCAEKTLAVYKQVMGNE